MRAADNASKEDDDDGVLFIFPQLPVGQSLMLFAWIWLTRATV